MDWTTIEDTARYTAQAALDSNTPRFLTVAADRLSANSLAQMMTELTGRKYKILKPGGPSLFKGMIKMTKLTSPGKGQVYPAWQGMQYMHNMYKGDCKFTSLDNDRYEIDFKSAKSVVDDYLNDRSQQYQL